MVTFVKPESRNPLTIRTLESLKFALESIESEAEVQTLIFTGSGNTFASGADLNEVAELDSVSAFEFGKRGQDLMYSISKSRLKTIAAIDGFCMGGALDLAISCVRRIAAPTSKFAHPGASLGIITGWGGTQMLPRLIGTKNACDMFLTARRIDAREALRMGLIDEIAPEPLVRALSEPEFTR